MDDLDSSSDESCNWSNVSDFEDDDESSSDDMRNARDWCEIDFSSCPPAPPRFPFLGVPGLTFRVKNLEDPLEYFIHFFDDELMDIIVKQTNDFADEFLLNSDITPRSRALSWEEVSKEEIYVFFALLILMGINPKPRIDMYWSRDPLLEMPFIRKIMTEQRFRLIMKFLHFSNNDSENNSENRKLKKIKSISTNLFRKFQTSYNLERDICVDESLLLYKGRLSWKQYIPSKRARFGIKFFMLCESSSGYVHYATIYTGKDTIYDKKYESYGVSTKSVMSLMEGLLGMGHCLIVDNFYNSPELAEILIQNKTDVYGTLRCNRKDLPIGLKSSKLKEEKKGKLKEGETIAFQKGKMLVIKWMDKKPVTMLSTVHSAKMVDIPCKGHKKACQKPSSIADYNNTMGGVDRMDSCLSNYSTKRKRQKKFYKKIFFHLLDLSIWNSFVLYKKNEGSLNHLDFRLKLIKRIIERFNSRVMLHASSKKVESPLRFTGQHFPSKIPATGKKAEPTRCCAVCCSKKKDSGKKIRKETRYCCPKCDVALCPAPCFETYHTPDEYSM